MQSNVPFFVNACSMVPLHVQDKTSKVNINFTYPVQYYHDDEQYCFVFLYYSNFKRVSNKKRYRELVMILILNVYCNIKFCCIYNNNNNEKGTFSILFRPFYEI